MTNRSRATSEMVSAIDDPKESIELDKATRVRRRESARFRAFESVHVVNVDLWLSPQLCECFF